MMFRCLAVASVLAVASGGAALADSMPMVDMPAMAMPASPLVQAFAQAAGLSNQFEMTESQVALENSSNPEIQSFARRMIADHSMAERELTRAAQPTGVVTHFMLPKPMQDKVDALEGLSGPAFDRAYLADQQEAHASAAAMLAGYAASGSDPTLVAYAQETLPIVRMHQQMLVSIMAGQSPLAMQ